jgi:lipoyl(octanoyl) transferase
VNAELRYRRLGEAAYEETLAAMRRFTDERGADTPDELWLLQHPRVFTQGQAGRAEHVLAPGAIPVVQVDRGGQVTYHGPGQWVVYLLVDLKRRGLGVRELVSLIERAIVTVLAGHGIEAAADPARPGVYVDGAKIASLGLRVRRGCSYHGLALNVSLDLEPFGRINPCGYEGLAVTSMAALLPGLQLDETAVGEALLSALDGEFAALSA